ncbi:cleavage and polyadenylation specificity factor subunit 4 [Vigna unguiculata]|uniref:Cleavage and polyadenylation specificity factor subunit 4 n=1 Tax=Vigna unguiculata TaxID=3917 RepID=A0A4D6L362_VIGUN|nr:cleavage and polyadenylation specificity factor subunit 4 [Vigna unguiculata]
MGLNDKHNNADGKDPDFGAIFMSNCETKRQCFKKGLFGLPSTEIQFVEQVKAGMILFLYEYEKRQLHGVFKASCDGGINIVPNAFAKLGKQFPAQVKFDPVWFCKPLPEKLFRDAIRENYFSANKFNFGLSENQVYKLIYLFSKRKLEPEPPGRPLSRPEYLKSERYPLGNVGRSVDHGMQIERGQSGLGLGDNISPVIMHKHQGDSFDYNGKVEYTGLNASDIKRGTTAQFSAVDNASEYEYVCDYSGLKDESRFIAYENEDYMDICHRPNITDGYPKSLCDKIRIHGEGSLSINDRLMGNSLPETDQRMVFSNDNPGQRNSHINSSGFYSNPILEHSSLVQNQLRSTSTMIQPMQAQLLSNTCATQGSANSKRSSLLYDPDVPGLNFSQASSFGVMDGSKPVIERITPVNNFGRNSLNSQPYLIHNNELKDTSRWHPVDFQKSVLYGSNRDFIPLNTVQNSDQLAAESVVSEACDDVPSLKSLSSPIPPDIGKSSRSLHEPFPSLFHNHQPWLGTEFHSTTLQENPSHEITLQKSSETFNHDILWANEGHFKEDDPLIYEYDIGCYGGTQNNNSGYAKKKSSVFSRLSFMQDINEQDGHNDFHTSVDEVMERVRQSHNKWMTKRMPKLKPKRNKAESLKDYTQRSSLRTKEGDFSENTLNDQIIDSTTATVGNTNKAAEVTCFVDFKRRSKVGKPSAGNENSVVGQQKRRKLIRPNFGNSLTSDDKVIDLDTSQNLGLGSCNVEDVKESCCALVQTEVNTKAGAEASDIISEIHSDDNNSCRAREYGSSDGGERTSNSALAVFSDKSEGLDSIKVDTNIQNINGGTHTEDKETNHARGYVCGEGGQKATEGALTAFSDGSKCLENVTHNSFSSASCRGDRCHTKKGLCTMDIIKSVSLNSKSSFSICQDHQVHKIECAGGGTNADKEIPKECSTITVKDGSEKVLIETSAPINESLHGIDSLKQVHAGTDSMCSICEEHDKITSSGRGSNSTEQLSKDGSSFDGVKDGFDCLQNSNIETGAIVPSFFKEVLSMTESKKSVCSDSESLPSLCLECAGRPIKTEDCRSSVLTEVKDGSDGSQNCGYTCKQKMI